MPIHAWAHTIVPRHVCARTRLSPHMLVPTHVCTQTRLYPDPLVPTQVCTQTHLWPEMFMTEHNYCAHTWLWSHDPVHILYDCSHTQLCPYTITPIHDRAHSTVPMQDCRHVQLSRDKNVPRHNCTHKQYCTSNFAPTIVPRRDCAHTMRVFSRKLDT